MILLIDNCTLIQLVHSEAYGRYLIELENYIQTGQITLLTHQTIIEEWEKHKPANKERIVKKLRKQNSQSIGDGSASLPTPINVNHIELQYEQIDRLLHNAELLTTPEKIEFEFAERYRKRLAPFHIKRDSQNDWEIFGSAAHHCERIGETKLFFLSSNSTDFADPEAPQRAIHPDLQIRFPKVKIAYFREIADFLNGMSELILPDRLLTYSIVRNKKFSYNASVRKHDLDSLYHLLKNTYSEVAFIPPHLLKKYYPFAKSANSHAYYYQFSLNNVRSELVKLFTGIQVKKREVTIVDYSLFAGVSDAKEKLEFVLLRLTGNLIFKLNSAPDLTSVMIRYHAHSPCDCVRCAYNRLEWNKSLAQLNQSHENPLDQLKTAYYNYQFGYYTTAARMMIAIRSEAFEQKQYITYFICQFNLQQLSFLSSSVFYPTSLSAEEIDSLREIDPIEEAVKLKSFTDYDLLAYIADGKFFKAAFDRIVQLSSQIEDHYHSFLQGGWSVNSHINSLTAEFAELETFVNGNFIVYDVYENWDRMFDHVIKGLFASHAMRETDNSALEYFDDFWISAFILYGNKKTIEKYFERFNLKNLEYKRSNANGGFQKMAENHFYTKKDTLGILSHVEHENNEHYHQQYDKISQNLLVLAALLEPNSFDVNLFARQVLTYLMNKSTWNRNVLTAVADFISMKGKCFNQSVHKAYLSYFIETVGDYEFNLLAAIISTSPTGKIKSNAIQKILQVILSTKRNREKIPALELIRFTAKKSNDSQKKIITDTIITQLTEHFEFPLFYYATMYDIISLDEKRLFKLIDEVDLTKKGHSFRSFATGHNDEYITRLDDLVNMCFKFDINVKLKRFERLKEAGDYYTWLLNMDAFDYNNFRCEWLNHYKTKYYYKAMARSKKLRQVMQAYLKEHSDPVVEQALIQISVHLS
ncbi:DUF4935 domain-containing protein [Pedobacter sp. HMF7647]|uniref:DUF4935 domain-containing protein n=1 Tax=Hufsiella arboris TaxID=2695275 RepID=A0A7K1Y8H6_9SPHI|nr:PIN domain-containing protein [Hufsiella arboris]MXV50348.1 DUF4935 domain-containing protein [Hufsiella arboris]